MSIFDYPVNETYGLIIKSKHMVDQTEGNVTFMRCTSHHFIYHGPTFVPSFSASSNPCLPRVLTFEYRASFLHSSMSWSNLVIEMPCPCLSVTILSHCLTASLYS